jgi:putative ABC transport system permease protein
VLLHLLQVLPLADAEYTQQETPGGTYPLLACEQELAMSHPPFRSRISIPSIVILAFWRVRQTWRLLLLAGTGILIAVTLVCTVPLYSEVAQVAGLRGVLTATPRDSELTLQATGNTLTPAIVDQASQSLHQVIQQHLGPYLQPGAAFFLTVPQTAMTAPASAKSAGQDIGFTGASMSEAAHHLHVLRGRLPQPFSQQLEIAITQDTAAYLKMDIGSVLTVQSNLRERSSTFQSKAAQFTFQVVGIIASVVPSDPYWHGQTFEPPQCPCFFPPTQFEALMSSDTYLAVLQQIVRGFHMPDGMPFYYGEAPTLFWYYHLNAAQIDVAHLNDLIAQLRVTQTQIGVGNIAGLLAGTNAISSTQLSGPTLESSLGPSTLEQFRSRISLVNVPVLLLLLQVVGLILFFIGLMASLLVDRQAEVITLLRSRGASRHLIFGTFLVQCLALALLALIVGPLLALPFTRFLAWVTLPSSGHQALSVISGNPLPVVLGVGWFAVAAALGPF